MYQPTMSDVFTGLDKLAEHVNAIATRVNELSILITKLGAKR